MIQIIVDVLAVIGAISVLFLIICIWIASFEGNPFA